MKSFVFAILVTAFVAAAFGEVVEDSDQLLRLPREADPAKPNRPIYIPPPRPPHPRLRRDADPEAKPEAEPGKPSRPVYVPPPRPPHPRLRREADPGKPRPNPKPIHLPGPRPHPRLR
ncbi:apidaecins type 22-like [Ceratina calcarata]|uniref:Apidaecins type 22-like n=1 Tax=Ceratina calcarata TaxID=156304 RepID=A0AAJ7NEN1_9HYME|nr:apidaecins type 22-like [Ceratina calcarata]